jgi:hypothetical protein
MSATIIKENRDTTLPADVCEPAGIRPGDQIEWRFESGEIRGRRLAPTEREEIGLADIDPQTLLPKGGWKITAASIVRAIRADREGKT